MDALPPPLQRIANDLHALDEHSPASLAAALRGPITIDDVAPWIHFSAENYTRNLVVRTERWELRLLCWRPGQSSSLHGHGPAACAFRVLRGSATETILGSRDRKWAPGDIVAEDRSRLVHQVANVEGDSLLTLHAYSPRLPVDTPSARAGSNIVIIGGGFAGIAAAFHLLRRGRADTRITLVERGPWLGRGIAYGVDSEVFRLNVPAAKMSIDPADRDDFVRWSSTEDPDAFLSRASYGAYVVERFGDALRTSPGKLRVVRGEAHRIDDGGVELTDGRHLAAEKIVLATGLQPRLAQSSLPADPRIIDAWDECALAALPRTGRLLVLGAGLTALDVLAFLNLHGFAGSVSILSRRGLLPAPHATPLHSSVALSDAMLSAAPRDISGLLRWGRRLIAETVSTGAPWQHALDAIRPHVARLWRGLPPDERVRFIRRVRPYWEVLRHRAPGDVYALVERWQREGRLQRIAGTVATCRPGAAALEVDVLVAGGETRVEQYDAIVRCIGPALLRSETDAPLLRDLIASGRAAADPVGLGIVTDEAGRIVDGTARSSDRLFALGALRRASSWETTAVPDIAAHAAAMARLIYS